jgi:predicted transcriptional regulator
MLVVTCFNLATCHTRECVFEEMSMATTSVRLDQDLIEKATIMAKAFNRTPPKQIEHWAKIEEIMEDDPDLPYEFVKQAIIAKAEKEAGKLESYDIG